MPVLLKVSLGINRIKRPPKNYLISAMTVLGLLLALLVPEVGLAEGGLESNNNRENPPPSQSLYESSSNTEIARVIIKFKEKTGVRIRNGELTPARIEEFPRGFGIAQLRAELGNIEHLLQSRGLGARRNFRSLSEIELESMVQRGESRTQRSLQSLNLFFEVPVPRGTRFSDVKELIGRLNSNSSVEVAYAEPITEPSMHLATPDFEANQSYLGSPPNGINAHYAWTIQGGRGEGVKIIDIEFAWNLSHEDFPPLFFDSGGYNDGSSDIDHGTAVAGVIAAKDNGYGVTGIASQASFGVQTIIGSISTSDAIVSAANRVSPGGVIVIPLHRKGPAQGGNCTCNEDQCHYIALEFWPADFTAIQTATANGVIVVEIAGNGSADLDDPVYDEKFDLTYRDSGAILVGASHSESRAPTCWTNYGSRVDVHGWGENVATLGYGDLFLGGHGTMDQWYTDSFSGTSSASPIVAGAVASIQGVAKAEQSAMLGPLQMRALLRVTGTPQSGDLSRSIGPLPDLERALSNIPTLASQDWLPAIYLLILN